MPKNQSNNTQLIDEMHETLTKANIENKIIRRIIGTCKNENRTSLMNINNFLKNVPEELLPQVLQHHDVLLKRENLKTLLQHFQHNEPTSKEHVSYNKALCDDLSNHKDDTNYRNARLDALSNISPTVANKLELLTSNPSERAPSEEISDGEEDRQAIQYTQGGPQEGCTTVTPLLDKTIRDLHKSQNQVFVHMEDKKQTSLSHANVIGHLHSLIEDDRQGGAFLTFSEPSMEISANAPQPQPLQGKQNVTLLFPKLETEESAPLLHQTFFTNALSKEKVNELKKLLNQDRKHPLALAWRKRNNSKIIDSDCLDFHEKNLENIEFFNVNHKDGINLSKLHSSPFFSQHVRADLRIGENNVSAQAKTDAPNRFFTWSNGNATWDPNFSFIGKIVYAAIDKNQNALFGSAEMGGHIAQFGILDPSQDEIKNIKEAATSLIADNPFSHIVSGASIRHAKPNDIIEYTSNTPEGHSILSTNPHTPEMMRQLKIDSNKNFFMTFPCNQNSSFDLPVNKYKQNGSILKLIEDKLTNQAIIVQYQGQGRSSTLFVSRDLINDKQWDILKGSAINSGQPIMVQIEWNKEKGEKPLSIKDSREGNQIFR